MGVQPSRHHQIGWLIQHPDRSTARWRSRFAHGADSPCWSAAGMIPSGGTGPSHGQTNLAASGASSPRRDAPLPDQRRLSMTTRLVSHVGSLCSSRPISDATFYNWRNRYGGMEVSDARRLKALDDENRRGGNADSCGISIPLHCHFQEVSVSVTAHPRNH